MEMPITVMVMFVVAIAVGIGILNFSQQTLGQGQNEISQLGVEEEQISDTVITVNSISDQMVLNLARQCAEDTVSPEITLCYVINVQSADVTAINNLDGEKLTVRGVEFTIKSSISGNPNAIFIYYDPLGFIQIKT